MRALITGAGGQLGLELIEGASPDTDLVALDRNALDIADEGAVGDAVADHKPDVILNAAAYTAVDLAEEEFDRADAVNAAGPGFLRDAAAAGGARLIHVSTDFVFDGAASEPYGSDAVPAPQSVYAKTKLRGEMAVLENPGAAVIRTSRVYSRFGRNFVSSMLDLMRTRDELQVVDDQIGSPTSASGLAQVMWRFAGRSNLTGLWHWTDSGSCTWYEWACAIQAEALDRALLIRGVPIHPVSTADYPTSASRPAYSVLDCSRTVAALGLPQRPWREALSTMLDGMVAPPTRPKPLGDKA